MAINEKLMKKVNMLMRKEPDFVIYRKKSFGMQVSLDRRAYILPRVK